MRERFPASIQTDSGAPNHLYNGHWGSFSGIKRPERGVHHHPDLAPTLKGTATHLLLLCAFMACYWVNFTSSYKHNISYVEVRRLKEFNCTNWCSLIITYSFFFLWFFGPFLGYGLPMKFRKNSVWVCVCYPMPNPQT
jgi:hypothetical protein